MTLKLAIQYLTKKYDLAQQNEYIKKPLAWALYQTWKYVDSKEKARSCRTDKEDRYGR